MSERYLPVKCPSCGDALHGERFSCPGCGTAVEGDFLLPTLARLSREEQQFVLDFVKSSGSLKQLAKLHSVSYPTVRNRVDALIASITRIESGGNSKENAS